VAEQPHVHLCVGSDCRKDRPGAHRKLRARLSAGGVAVTPVKCQKICKGPVVGIRVDGTLHWVRKVVGRELREDLVRLLEKGRWSKGLRKRRVRKRQGKLRS